MQITIYNNDPNPNDYRGDKSEVRWGWRYGSDDTGLVFTSRDDAFADAFAEHPDQPIG